MLFVHYNTDENNSSGVKMNAQKVLRKLLSVLLAGKSIILRHIL